MKPLEPGSEIVVAESAAATVFETRPHLKDAVRDYIRASEAPNTARARRADWAVFSAWCGEKELAPLPADAATVAAFLADQSRGDEKRRPKAVATVIRYLRSIHAVHRLSNATSPAAHEAVRQTLRGIRRERGTRQERKEALTAGLVVQLAPKALPGENQIRELRDRVVILLGLATAMRESELCAIDIDDIKPVDGGLVIMLKKSKTDQEGVGRPLAVPRLKKTPEFCPVRAVERWIAVLGRQTGPLLYGLLRNGRPGKRRLGGGSVNEIVKRFVRAGGLDGDKFGGHSLRAGFVTTARQQGVDWTSIMEQTGHKRLETAKLYTRYTPDVFVATRVVDVFDGAFARQKKRATRK